VDASPCKIIRCERRDSNPRGSLHGNLSPVSQSRNPQDTKALREDASAEVPVLVPTSPKAVFGAEFRFPTRAFSRRSCVRKNASVVECARPCATR
jgi:hypothetical protein